MRTLRYSIVLLIITLYMIVYLVTFQVFFSSYIFKANVMVHVATQQADNPVSTQLKGTLITEQYKIKAHLINLFCCQKG